MVERPLRPRSVQPADEHFPIPHVRSAHQPRADHLVPRRVQPATASRSPSPPRTPRAPTPSIALPGDLGALLRRAWPAALPADPAAVCAYLSSAPRTGRSCGRGVRNWPAEPAPALVQRVSGQPHDMQEIHHRDGVRGFLGRGGFEVVECSVMSVSHFWFGRFAVKSWVRRSFSSPTGQQVIVYRRIWLASRTASGCERRRLQRSSTAATRGYPRHRCRRRGAHR